MRQIDILHLSGCAAIYGSGLAMFCGDAYASITCAVLGALLGLITLALIACGEEDT